VPVTRLGKGPGNIAAQSLFEIMAIYYEFKAEPTQGWSRGLGAPCLCPPTDAVALPSAPKTRFRNRN